ncbi:MAG: hypothetical protein IKB95_07215, partial [Bacteroidales bacterium]|nr:hypothetical protein [Bacteroidales bacterium]
MAVTAEKNGEIKSEETDISVNNLKENTLVQGANGEELVLTKKGQVMGVKEYKFAASKPKLREKLKKELKGTLPEKAKDFGEAFAQEYIAYILVKTIEGARYSKFNSETFGSFLTKLLTTKDIYESSFLNALNSLKSNSSDGKITISGFLNDFCSGIEYSYLFSDSPDKIRRIVVLGSYNVIKNLLAGKLKINSFLGGQLYQIISDYPKNLLNDYLEQIGIFYKKELNNYKYNLMD